MINEKFLLSQMENASAWIIMTAATANGEVASHGYWLCDHEVKARYWQSIYDEALNKLNSLIDEKPITPEIVIKKVDIGRGCYIKADPELRLKVELTVDDLLRVRLDELHIDVTADLHRLIDQLNSQIRMLWIEYARAPDESLDPLAIKLKRSLLKRFVEDTEPR